MAQVVPLPPAGYAATTLGRYRLLLNLGQGGMGTIHLALAEGSGGFEKLVVIKELREERARDAAFVELFLAEAKLAGQLNHPNVVQTIEATRVDGRLFLAMEFLEGQSLSELMRAGGMPERLALQVLCDTLAGLHYAHELQDYGGNALAIVHCDVSPQNIFVTYDGHTKIVDFGIARAAGQAESGGFRGRLAYASPEQIRGGSLDRRTDVFALGVVLWEVLAKRRLVPRDTPQKEIVAARLAGTEPRIRAAVPSIHPRLAAICDRALAMDPAERFGTAEEFRVALSQYMRERDKISTPAEVGAFMSLKFRSERAAQNALIHERMNGEHSALKLRPRVSIVPSSSDFEVTQVGELSELLEMTRSDGRVGGSSAPPAEGKTSWPSRGAIAGITLAFAAALLLSVTSWLPESALATRAPWARQATVKPPVSEPGPLPVTTGRELDEAASPRPLSTAVLALVPEPSPSPEVGPKAASVQPDVTEVELAEAPEPSRPPVRKWRPRRHVAKSKSQPKAKGARTSAADKRGLERQADATPGLGIGEDLMSAKGRVHRSLDEDNPFR